MPVWARVRWFPTVWRYTAGSITFGLASRPIFLSISAYASVTLPVTSMLFPHTVTSVPSAPACLIKSRARSRSGGSFGSPQGQSLVSSASS